ncbi:hypothetical protein [Aliivibrio kagoshimensis]|uniref:hypothetical protein n=1 Tax=Aliivibrio kagoshimensis TaxID=2910230 RepID=UPI003D110C88
MITKIKSWFIIDVYKDASITELIGKALSGIVISDELGRFEHNEHICTANINNIDEECTAVTTTTGQTYALIGAGELIEMTQSQFGLLVRIGSMHKYKRLIEKLQLDGKDLVSEVLPESLFKEIERDRASGKLNDLVFNNKKSQF